MLYLVFLRIHVKYVQSIGVIFTIDLFSNANSLL